MGELYEALDEFQQISREYFVRIMKILEDKYCWKCPMRVTSSEALCREIDSWMRLIQALEWGIQNEIHENHSLEILELVTARFMEKKMNPQRKTIKKELFIQLENDAQPFATEGDYLLIKSHPRRVRVDDLVLLTKACPLATYWYLQSKSKDRIPFNISKVSRVLSKKGIKYIQTEDGLEVPLEFIIGLIIEIIDQKHLKFRETKIKNIKSKK